MTDIKGTPGGESGQTNRLYHDEGDGTHSEAHAAHIRGWDATDLAWYRLPVDHATGALNVKVSGAGSGGTSSVDGDTFVAYSNAGTGMMGERDDTSTASLAENTVGIARLTQWRAQHVYLVDSAGAGVSVGGGTQYVEGAGSASLTGTVALWKDVGNVTTAVSASKPLPASLVHGVTFGGTVSLGGPVSVLQNTSPWIVGSGTASLAVTANQATSPWVVGSGSASLTVSANQATSPWVVGSGTGSLAVTANQVGTWTVGSGTGSLTVAANQAGGWTVQPGNTANTTPWLVSLATVPTHAVTQSGSPWQENLVSLASAAVAVNSGNKDAGTQRIVIATDQPQLTNPVPVSLAALPTGTNSIGDVNLTAEARGGFTPFRLSGLTGSLSVSSSLGKFGGCVVINLNSAPAYMQVFDSSAASNVSLGSTAPTFSIPIPANATAANGAAIVVPFDVGLKISNGIKVAATTTENGGATVATALTGLIYYKSA